MEMMSARLPISNRLDVARMQIAFGKGTLLTLSNRLDDLSGRLDASQSAALAFSNQLMEAESAVALDAEQITNLNRSLPARNRKTKP